jgi:hypothetical protein
MELVSLLVRYLAINAGLGALMKLVLRLPFQLEARCFSSYLKPAEFYLTFLQIREPETMYHLRNTRSGSQEDSVHKLKSMQI